MEANQLAITVGETVGRISGLYVEPPAAHTLYVLAHGAGANMRHRFMEQVAEQLGAAGIATLRYNFPYMETGSRRPDPTGILEATVRAAIEQGAQLAGGRTLIAGGKSMGGRMTSQALAKRPDDRVRGIAFLGFPLHAPGKPATERAAHLADVRAPMLFLQGTRDSLARIDLIREVCDSLGDRATLHIIDQADHSFAVPKRTGLTADDIYRELAVAINEWSPRVVGS
jgi:hypothetical protein